MKFVRVMDGLKSNAGGFDYKLDEINISKKQIIATTIKHINLLLFKLKISFKHSAVA